MSQYGGNSMYGGQNPYGMNPMMGMPMGYNVGVLSAFPS